MANTRMCPNCRAFIDAKERVCPYCQTEQQPVHRQSASPTGTALRGLIPETHFTTVILLAVNFGLFIVMMLLSQKVSGSFFSIDLRVAELFGAKVRFNILQEGQWWRLMTAGFLHGGIMHILMNSWVLFDLGAQVEDVLGTARYLAIYLVSSVFGFYVSLQITAADSLGASAALSGLIGAMMAFARRTGQSFVWSFYLRWAILIAVIGLLFPAIDNAAHFGGFVAGFGMGWIAASPRINRATESMWKAAAAVCSVIAAGCIAYACLRASIVISNL